LNTEDKIFKNFKSKDIIYGLLIEDISPDGFVVGNKFFDMLGKLFTKKLTKFNPFTENSELRELLIKMLHPSPKHRSGLAEIIKDLKWMEKGNAV